MYQKIILILLSTCLVYACRNKYDIVKEIYNIYEQGTDSTTQWIYKKNDCLLLINHPEKGQLNQMITGTGGNTYILTKFIFDEYNKDIKLIKIENLFYIDSKADNFGHYFDFSKVDTFYKYYWLVGIDNIVSYISYFDNRGNILYEEGSIVVDTYKHANNIKDILITSVLHNIDSIVVINSFNEKRTLKTLKHNWMPMLDYFELDFNVDSLYKLEVYASLKNGKGKRIFYETIFNNQN